MNDMERDADRIGRRLWPQPRAVLERLGASGRSTGVIAGRRSVLVGLATAAALVAVLVTALALRGQGRPAPGGTGAGVVAPAPATPTPTAPPTTAAAEPATASVSTATAGTGTLVVPGTPTPRPPTPTPPTGTVTLTAADSGRTISVHAGTAIVVDLSASQTYRWTEPDTSNAGVVRRTGGAAHADGSATATFDAIASGTADLTAVDNPDCSPQCLWPVRLWKVSVVVTP